MSKRDAKVSRRLSQLPTAPPPSRSDWDLVWEHEAPTKPTGGRLPRALEELVKPSSRDPRRE